MLPYIKQLDCKSFNLLLEAVKRIYGSIVLYYKENNQDHPNLYTVFTISSLISFSVKHANEGKAARGPYVLVMHI